MNTKTNYCKIILLLVIMRLYSTSYAGNVCEFTFSDCPQSFNGDTISVPENVVAMSSSIKACSTSISSISGGSLPPSIVFVIDHSGSMSGDGTEGNDEMGSRFTVSRSLIDTLYKRQPNAEVGIVAFREHLFFDKTTGQYFTTYFKTLPVTYDNEPNQAYLQMLTLNRTYGAKKGIDIIKDVLSTDTVRKNSNTFVDLTYKPSFDNTANTNINIGFIAAKDAMKSAANPPDRQFVIFFSDGEPKGNSQAGLPINDFISGKGMPTTFTVFFTRNIVAPQSIQLLTDNIKKNGYSTSNPESNLWAIQTNHDALLDLLMSNVVNNLLVSGNPNTMTINGIKSISATDSSFIYANKFPLLADYTPFNSTIRYRFTNPVDNSTHDTLITLNFVVHRTNTNVSPSSIQTNCWEQPEIGFYYEGSLIKEATEDMKQIQVRFTHSGEKVNSVSVDVESSLESIPLILRQNGNTYWENTITRETKNTASNDNILQHVSGDSIIAVYRNPLIPLDTVRVAIPIRAHPNAIPVTAVLRDTSGDGHIDRIDLSWTVDTISLIAILPAAEKLLTNASITSTDGPLTNLLPDMLIAKGARTLSITVKENSGIKRETGWTKAVVTLSAITMTQQGNSFYVEKVIDGAGPVVGRAIYFPGKESEFRDTLKIIFSEPVKCEKLIGGSPSDALLYVKNGSIDPEVISGASYLENCVSEYITEVKIALKSGVVTPLKDSLALIGNSRSVVDKEENTPPINNKRVPIEWGVQNEISVGVSVNPFTPGITTFYAKTNEVYANSIKGRKTGVLIGISTLKPLQKNINGSYGKAVIYDNLGNLITDPLQVMDASLNNTYGIYWDGRNKNNRVVASGAYLMVITVESDGRVFTQKIKIGVKL